MNCDFADDIHAKEYNVRPSYIKLEKPSKATNQKNLETQQKTKDKKNDKIPNRTEEQSSINDAHIIEIK